MPLFSAMDQDLEMDYQLIFNTMPGSFLVLRPNHPEYTILAVSDVLLQATARERRNMVGRSIFEAFLENPDAPGVAHIREALHETCQTKKPNELPVVRYDVPNAVGAFEERYWSVNNTPVTDHDGELKYIIYTTADITKQFLAEKQSSELTEQLASSQLKEESYARFRGTVERAPVAIAVFRGDNFVAEVANDAYLPIAGVGREDLIGKPLFDVLPQTRETLEPIAREMMRTGKPFPAKEFEIVLKRDGKEETCYFDSVWEPYYENDGTVDGFIVVAHEVTDRVLSRKKTEVSEEQIRSFVNGAPFPIGVYIGPEMRIQYANQAMLHAYGKSADVIGKRYEEVLSEMGPAVFQQLKEVYNTGVPFHAKNQHMEVIREGERMSFFYDYSLIPLFDAQGNIYGVMNTAADVTQFSLANKKLEESESRFRNMVEQAPVAITLTRGRDMVIESINTPMLRIMGKTEEEEVLGLRMVEVLPEIKDQAILDIVLSVMETGKAFEGAEVPVHLWVAHSMEERFFNLSYTPLIEDGAVTGVIHVALDVTEQVIARKRIEESQAQLKGIIEATPECIKIISGDGTLQYMNPVGLNMIEGDPGLLGCANVLDVIAPEYRPQWARNHKRVCKGESLSWEFDIVGLKGTRRRMETHAVPLHNGQGTHQLAVTRDVTARKASEEALELKNAQLTRINNDLDNFIYTASHDLKAPISNIEGLLDLLSDDLETGKAPAGEVQRIISMMHAAVERFKKTIESLTDVVKLQQESIADAVLVNLHEVVQEVRLDMEPSIKKAGVKLEVDLDRHTTIRFSQKNLRSVIYNLLSNAIKYRSPERTPVIKVSCASTATHHELTVADNGMGIAGPLDKLFTMFRRFHDHVEGTGVGLYMVKKMVENAGGSIEVESQEGSGSTFRVYFQK
ncbi:PAS domain-containing sensor histidine kinase [Pontibacter sp. CAU 1760]